MTKRSDLVHVSERDNEEEDEEEKDDQKAQS
jgi:hypothetical protein